MLHGDRDPGSQLWRETLTTNRRQAARSRIVQIALAMRWLGVPQARDGAGVAHTMQQAAADLLSDEPH